MGSTRRPSGPTLLLSLGLLAGLAVKPATAGVCTPLRPELARGFSLTGWLDEAKPREPDFVTLRSLRGRGFLHVRLPVLAENLMPRFVSAETAQATRVALTAAIDRLTALGYAVVVDMHGDSGLHALFQTDPDAARDAVIGAWTALGPMMRARADKAVMAEVLNEPPVSDLVWADMQPRIVAAMRIAMPATTFVVSTGGPQRVERLTASKPIGDRNTVYAVHYYDPMAFTHQGAAWMKPDPIAWLHDVPFPILLGDQRLVKLAASLRAAGLTSVAAYVEGFHDRSFGVAEVRAHIRSLADWSTTNGRQVVIGEFGVYRGAVSQVYRAQWLATVSRAAVDNCIGWTHWEYRDGFGLLDGKTGVPDEGTLNALVGITPIADRPYGDPPRGTAGAAGR